MFEHLSNDHSLFYVNDRHLAQFLTLFDSLQHALLEYPIQHGNVAPAIYNFWLLLNSEHTQIYYNEERRFTHSAHRYFFDTLIADTSLQHSLTTSTDSREIFLLAYFLGIELSKWLMGIIARRNQLHLRTPFLDHSYYTVRERQMTSEQFSERLSEQKALTILMQQDQKHENTLKKHIQQALLTTQHVYDTYIFIES